MMIAYDRKRTSTLTLDEQPGAHTGATRQYIPGYSYSNIVYLNTASGNDSNDGSTELLAKLTYASAATAAGSTKKIRVVNDGAALSTNITKPTEMKRGISASISADYATAWNTWTSAGTPSFGADNVNDVIYSRVAARFIAVGNTGKLAYSTNGNVWTQAATPSFGGSNVQAVSENTSIIVAVGNSGKIATSIDGDTWTQRTSPTTATLTWVSFNSALGLFAACGSDSVIVLSADGITWRVAASLPNAGAVGSTVWSIESNPEGRFIAVADSSKIFYSDDGENWFPVGETPGGSFSSVTYNTLRKEFLAASGGSATWYRSSDGLTWEDFAPGFGVSQCRYVKDLGIYVGLGSGVYKISWSSTGDSWTSAATPVIIASRSFAVSPSLLGVVVGDSAGIVYKQVTMPDISADIAGFSISGATYTGTRTLYNCTLGCPTTTAPVNLNACRVREAGASFSNNTQAHSGTLFEGDTYFTTTPASQNVFSLNSNTFGGKCYILNSSQTGYEQIRDNLFADGIDATWGVTVSGRDNVQGVSSNALFGFEVTFNDPKFVDETDYTLQYQTNGYDRNSLAAGRSNIYYNSAGGRRDIGAWSYIESAVTYYHAKTAYISKPTKISVTYEETVSEQQGDNGPVSVYTKPSRVKEILTLVYDVTEAADRAIFDYIRTLTDKGVKVQLFPEWGMNGSTVVVNGNQSAGVEFLTVDAVQVFNGLFLTIAGERYYVLRASPNNTAATKLILDRPLGVSVSDNDVIATNYPPGAGEYQFSPPPQLTLEYVDPDTLLTFMRGQTLRFVREWSP
jgi:hypothetical protein